MSLLSWMRNRTSTQISRSRTQHRSAPPRFRPQLETLEGRDVPSTLTVTSAADSGPGSLRAEIAAAQSGDTIVFAPSLNGQTITLTSGLLDLNKNLTIQGPGASQLTVSGDNKSAAFKVESQTQVTLSGLTITDSSGGTSGGAIYNNGTLTVSACNIAQNHAFFGGGIYNLGTLTLNSSTLSANTATENGGGVYNAAGAKLIASGSTLSSDVADLNGGGIYDSISSTATLTNCTLANNSAYASVGLGNSAVGGGGLYVDLDSTATLTNCTLSLNSAKFGHGGGIEVKSGGTLNLTNTIIAGNTAGHSGPDISGAVATADHNLVGDGTGSSGLANGSGGNLVGGNGNPVINADLGVLQNNGGPTQTMALLTGSPAIGQADNSKAPATDQRAVTRRDEAGETTDIGAFEL